MLKNYLRVAMRQLAVNKAQSFINIGGNHPITYKNNTVIQSGNFMEPAITDMLSLKMLEGNAASLEDLWPPC